MSQRIRRAQDRKATMATGGHVVHHDRGMDPIVRVPQKATGDVKGDKLAGLAKASPFFKPLAELPPATKADEKKAVAEASQNVEDNEIESDEQEND